MDVSLFLIHSYTKSKFLHPLQAFPSAVDSEFLPPSESWPVCFQFYYFQVAHPHRC